MPYPNQHAAHIADVAAFDKDSIRTEDKGDGVSVIMGKRKGSQTEEPISYRFDKDKFSPDEAKAWLEEHKIGVKTFEPASEEETQADPDRKRGEGDALPMPDDQRPKDGRGRKEKPGGDDDDKEDRAFDVPFLAPGTLTPKSGKPFELTADEIKRCMEDTNALIADGTLDPPGKLTHDKKLADSAEEVFGSGALGRVRSLYMNGDRLVARMQGASAKFADAVKRGVWHNRSAELVRNWRHPLTGKVYPMIVKAISWLGSEMPAVPLRELYGLAADDGETIEILTDGSQGDGQAGIGNGNPVTGDDDPAPTDREPTVKTEDTMTEEQKVALAAAEETAQKATEQIAGMRTKLLTTQLTALVKDRRIKPADMDKHLKLCQGMTEELAEIHLADLGERTQHEDETKPLATTKTPETKPDELKGEALLLSVAAELFDEGKSGKSYEGCIKLAATRNPEADAAYEVQYERGPIKEGV